MNLNNQQPGAPIVPTPVAPPPTSPNLGGVPLPPPNPGKKNTAVIVAIVVISLLVVGSAIALVVVSYNKFTQGTEDLYQKTVLKEKNSQTKTEATDNDKNQAVAVASDCVSVDDLRQGFKIMKNYEYADDLMASNHFYSDAVFFEAGSTGLRFSELDNERLDELANFYKNNQNKHFIYKIRSSVYEGPGTPAGSETPLAIARAEMIKSELTKRGVPESRIVINETVAQASNPDSARSATISLEKSGTCAVTP